MKYKLFASLLIIALAMAVSPDSAGAYAYESGFKTSITYQNIGTGNATAITISFYESPSDIDPIVVPRPALAQWAGTSVAVGSLTEVPSGFTGTAVMASDQALASTMVQNPQNANVRIAPLSNAFTSGQQYTRLATVLKNSSGVHTKFSVQNTGGSSTTATIKFYPLGSASSIHTITQLLQPGAGYHVDVGTLALPAPYNVTFNGTVVINATNASDQLVSSAMELDFGTGVGAKSFEGVSGGSTSVYMPSAACQSSGMNSAYAVQNTDATNPTDVLVTYQPGGYIQSQTIAANSKQSFISCNVLPPGYLGSAKITSSGGINIIAVGKISGNGAATAYNGFPNGFTKLALPYVRYATTANYNASHPMGRTNLTIENTSGAPIPANAITVTYYDRDGNVSGTPHVYASVLNDGAKFNSNASNAGLSEFGCYNSCTQFGGSAIVTVSGSFTIAVVARQSTKYGTSYPSEDYNGIQVQ